MELTPNEVIEKINNSIDEKTKGFAKSEDLAQFKEDLATAKELAEKSENYNDSDIKSAIAELEGKIVALKEEKKDEPKAKTLGESIFKPMEVLLWVC